MRFLRGVIQSINIKSLHCEIHQKELTEEQLSKNIQNGEFDFESWKADYVIHQERRERGGGYYSNGHWTNAVEATFKLRNRKLYDYALSFIKQPVILSIEEAEIINIEFVKQAMKCKSCNKRLFRSEFSSNPEICLKCHDVKRYHKKIG